MTGDISVDQIDAFRRDGVVMLSNMFESEWVELVRAGLSRHLASVSSKKTTSGEHLMAKLMRGATTSRR